ncbi:hypothetical protein BGZ83_001998 [Gryganskiella cystojenkinii]|nr:hypothetical protein BGZ83_001998 [Gryganskiella cystojenkinii]
MNQEILNGALPLLSNILGNDTAAGLIAVLNLAVNTVVMTTNALGQFGATTSSSSSKDYHQQQHFRQQSYGSYGQDQQKFSSDDSEKSSSSSFQSMILSTFAVVFSNLNATFQNLTHSSTPLTTYIALALLSYLAFRIVYGFVSWVIRSVLNMIKIAIVITILTTILWFIFNITSAGDSSDSFSAEAGGGAKGRHNDPISQLLGNLQTKFNAEYQRQQEFLQNPHVH